MVVADHDRLEGGALRAHLVGGGVQGGSGLRRRCRRLPGNPPGAFRARRERAQIGRADALAPLPLGARVGRLDDVAPGIGDQAAPRPARRRRARPGSLCSSGDTTIGPALPGGGSPGDRAADWPAASASASASARAEPASASASVASAGRRERRSGRAARASGGSPAVARATRLRRPAKLATISAVTPSSSTVSCAPALAPASWSASISGPSSRQQVGIGRHRRLDADDLARRLEIGIDGQQVDQRQHAGDRQQGPPRPGEVGVRRLQRTARNFLDIAHAPTVRALVPDSPPPQRTV